MVITAPAPPSHADIPLINSSILNKLFPHFSFSVESMPCSTSLLPFLLPLLMSNNSHTSVPTDPWVYMVFLNFFFFNRQTHRPRDVSSFATIDRCLSIELPADRAQSIALVTIQPSFMIRQGRSSLVLLPTSITEWFLSPLSCHTLYFLTDDDTSKHWSSVCPKVQHALSRTKPCDQAETRLMWYTSYPVLI